MGQKLANRNIIRNLLVQTPSVPGNLGRVATAIGLAGGDIGEIATVKIGPSWTMRNITVHCDDEVQLAEGTGSVRQLGGEIVLHSVSDEVLQAHEGGKIHMHSRLDVRSLADLRRVYTPGVASVCQADQRRTR